MTEAARVCEVGEPADDLTPDEALEWQRCGGSDGFL
jgi:hypothetical protein